MNIKTIKKLTLIYLVLLVAFFVVPLSYTQITYATSTPNNNFDNTSILDDLQGSTIDGVLFDAKNYVANKDKQLQMIYFNEYCYSAYQNGNYNYSLYAYIYNPQNLNITTNDGYNKIQIATDFDATGKANNYDKFLLKFCNKTSDNLLYKFKILDPKNIILNKVSELEEFLKGRKYDISGLEIATYGDNTIKEISSGATYLYSGYMSGYSTQKESTLKVNVTSLTTLQLKLDKTNYITSESSLDHYNNISSVYFSVPNNVLNEYGNLQKITAEWYEYKTAPIVVTSNNDFYKQALANNHTIISDPYTPEIPYTIGYGSKKITNNGILLKNDWTYNAYTGNNNVNLLPLIFYSPSNTINGVFNFLNSSTVAGDVSSSVLSDYIYNYKSNNYLEVPGRKIAQELFINDIDAERKKNGYNVGYNKKTVDFADTFEIKYFENKTSWLIPFLNIFDVNLSNEQTQNVLPIEAITNEKLNNDNISKDLLINPNDVNNFKNYCNTAYGNAETPFLFRFASSDYFAKESWRYPSAPQLFGTSINEDLYLAQETCFLDFDVIYLTFNKNSVYSVLPVTSSPVDVIGSITPPTPTEPILKDNINNFLQDIINLWNKKGSPLKIAVIVIAALIILSIIVSIIIKIVKAKNNKVTVNVVNEPQKKENKKRKPKK